MHLPASWSSTSTSYQQPMEMANGEWPIDSVAPPETRVHRNICCQAMSGNELGIHFICNPTLWRHRLYKKMLDEANNSSHSFVVTPQNHHRPSLSKLEAMAIEVGVMELNYWLEAHATLWRLSFSAGTRSLRNFPWRNPYNWSICRYRVLSYSKTV